MKEESLLDFYHKAILPQFGIEADTISWTQHLRLDQDIEARYFTIENERYILVNSDSGELPVSIEPYIEEDKESYSFLTPLKPSTPVAPIFMLTKDIGEVRYIPGITDHFLLIKFH